METVLLEVSSPQRHPNLDGSPERILRHDPDADIILRSGDLQEFRVLKLDIIRSSPILRDRIRASAMNSSDSSASSCAEGLPCYQLPDNGDVLSSLLGFILPVSPILPPTTEKIMELLSVAQKYDMSHALARIRGAVALQDPPFICPENAFHVYSLAQRYGLCQEVVQAARMALTFPMTIKCLEDKFDSMSGVHLHALWKYYQRVRISLRSDLTEFKTNGAQDALAGLTCWSRTTSGIPNWLDAYITSIEKQPALFDLTKFHMRLRTHAQKCTPCGAMPTKMIRDFWKALTNVFHNSTIKGEQDLLLLEENNNSQSHTNTTGTSPSLENVSLDPPHADVMLQSSNLVNFRVNKVVISVSSPFFADMFSLPQPPDNEVIDGLPVVHLSEDAETLNSLLTMLYPIPSALPDSYDKALRVLSAAQKYDMASVQSSIRFEIASWEHDLIRTGIEVFRAFAVSSGGKLFPEMEFSARHTLDFPMTLKYLSDELPLFEGWALRDLVRYRKRCRDRLVSTLDLFLDSNTQPSNIWVVCTTADSLKSYHRLDQVFPQWLYDLLSNHKAELQETFTNPFPNPSSIREEYLTSLTTHISSEDCIPCMRVHALKGETFCNTLVDQLMKALDKEFVSARD